LPVAGFDIVWHTKRQMKDGSYVKTAWGNNRRAFWGSVTAVLFGLAILAISLMTATDRARGSTESEAGTEAGELRVMTVVGQATASGSTATIEYYLPYPGLLPDSPVYKLKAARDRVWLWLTFDPIKKAEKELLYADKRINAAWVLAEGGKLSLGVTTATKAEKYLESSINRTTALAREGKDVKSLLQTQIKAAGKHAEVLQIIIEKSAGDDRVTLEKTLEMTQTLQKNGEQALRESK
jgi:hypothetical protein